MTLIAAKEILLQRRHGVYKTHEMFSDSLPETLFELYRKSNKYVTQQTSVNIPSTSQKPNDSEKETQRRRTHFAVKGIH